MKYSSPQQQRWRWVLGLGLLLMVMATAGLILLSWWEPAPTATLKSMNGDATNEELPPPDNRSAGPAAPDQRPPPAAAVTDAADTVAIGTRFPPTAPADSKNVARRASDQVAVKRPEADAGPGPSCSAATMAMALCDVKSR
jgi:hypothetical protein